MKKTTNGKGKKVIRIITRVGIILCLIWLFSFCYSYGLETSMEYGLEGVVTKLFGGLL